MSTVYANISHNGITKLVVLFAGIASDELTSLLTAVFNVKGNILGVSSENGAVIPLSLVCRSPGLLSDLDCQLVVSGQTASSERKVEQIDVEEESSESGSELEVTSEYVMQEIINFIDGLKARNFLSASHCRLLLELLLENSTLLFAAYSVAISAQDSEYFAEICKDLAQSLTTEEGRIACEAQDEVLQVSDQLYINNKITENQLLYLRHLVLIREESVASIYDEFQEHQSVPILAKALFDLSNNHPFQQPASQSAQNVQTAQSQTVKNRVNNTHAPSALKKQEPKSSSGNAYSEVLTGVVALMVRTRTLTDSEATVLLELIKARNDYVVAAYELFEYDKSLEELQDTLARVVKVEVRKRVAASPRGSTGGTSPRVVSPRSADKKEVVRESSAKENHSGIVVEIDYDNVSLTSILENVGIRQTWPGVPPKFVRLVFSSVLRKFLTVDQGRALCDLYESRYDLVVSAWEIYTVQEDAVDFIDTLRRVVRDLRFDSKDGTVRVQGEDSESEESGSDNDSESDGSSDSDSNDRGSREEEGEDSESKSDSKHSSDDDQDDEEDERSEQEPRSSPAKTSPAKTAENSVKEAKGKLLLHSLSMLIKEDMATTESANKLYERHLAGDRLVAAAIDSYAEDRDVAGFLTTLMTLLQAGDDELDEESDEEEQSLSEEGNTVEKRFLGIVQSMQLSQLETAALRLAIARSDPGITSAIENFRTNVDENELKRVLREIANRVMQGALGEKDEESEEDGEEEEQSGDDRREEESGSEGESSADNDGSDDGSDDGSELIANEAATSSLVTSHAARKHVFPILVNEFVKENIISDRTGATIMKHFEQDNAVIHTALDVFDQGNDMGQLVDSLQQFVDSL